MNDSGMPEQTRSDIEELERFVSNNDGLLKLEQIIGRFNIFDALGIVQTEIRHSNFLAWLLDPNGSHNQGGLFLRAFLMDLLRNSSLEHRPAGLNPIVIDGGDLQGVEIRREWQKIDLLIICNNPRFVIAIENKIRAGENSGQLERYKRIVGEKFPGTPSQFVFLTPQGDDPSDGDWTPYDYESLHEVFSRTIEFHRQAIGNEVLIFVQHYLSILRSNLMDDPRIDRLCRQIYLKHGQAIKLINDRVGSSSAQALLALEKRLQDVKKWRIINRTSVSLLCQPSAWNLPPINQRKTFKRNEWLFVEININEAQRWAAAFVRACPTTDRALREKIIRRLIQDPQEFGVKPNTARIGTAWATLDRKILMRWNEETSLDQEKFVEEAMKHLDNRVDELARFHRPSTRSWNSGGRTIPLDHSNPSPCRIANGRARGCQRGGRTNPYQRGIVSRQAWPDRL